MTGEQEPEFFTREIVDAIHEDQIDTFGGLHGVRDENALESAIASPGLEQRLSFVDKSYDRCVLDLLVFKD